MKLFYKALGLSTLFVFTALQSLAQIAPPSELSADKKEEILAKLGKIVTESAFAGGADFSKLPEALAKEKDEIAKAKSDDDFASAVNKALFSFGYSHIVLSTPKAVKTRIERKMVGLGIRIQEEPDGIRVVDIFPSGPAAQAGLEVDDLIILANGKKPEGRTSLLGEENSKILLKVKRGEGTKEIEVTRRTFSMDIPETVKWALPDVAVLKIPTFDLSYNRQRVEDLVKEASKAKLLIVDLRGNGGGAVVNLLHLSGMLLPETSKLGSFLSKSTVNRYVKEKGGDPKDLKAIAEWSHSKIGPFRTNVTRYSGHVAALINGGTGSASEMLAAALREIDGAELIGMRSAGAVLASVMVPLPYGYQLQYPITDYVTIKGVRLEGNGIKPDIEAPTPKANGPDKGVEEAINWYHALAKKP